VKPAPFEYRAPEDLDEALAVLAERGDEAKVLAGGQSLVPMLALRLTSFECLVDIGRVAELQGARREDGVLVVGAGTVDAAVGADPAVAASVPLLAEATPLIGHFQIRNRGTIGGSLAHADPAAEYPAVALALDAELEVASAAGRRVVPAAEFFEGTWTTALEGDEILTAARFSVWEGRCGFAVEELARRHGDFAVAGAAGGVALDPDGTVVRCAVALIGMESTPVRAWRAEAALVGTSPGPAEVVEAAQLAVDGIDPPADVHGSGAYRKKVGAEMVRRMLTRALEEAARV